MDKNTNYSDSVHQGDIVETNITNDPKAIIEAYELGKLQSSDKKINSNRSRKAKQAIRKTVIENYNLREKKRKNEKRFWSIVTIISLATLLVLLGQEYGGLFDSETNASQDTIVLESTADNPDPLSKECVDHSGLGRHDHSNLEIYINGDQRSIPTNLGINTDVCNQEGGNMHTVHTHDASGRLHIETAANVDMPLGVFFDIWGVHFNETGIFDYRVSNTHELIMTVDGVTNNEFDDYLLVDGKEIAIIFQAIS